MLETLRDTDREAYLASLFLAADVREDFATLWAFNAEIERIRSLISEPVPGEIRLQWWRDVISGDRAGEGAQHPIAQALLAVIEKHHLQIPAFDNLLEARIFDLYNDPMPDRATLEGYLGETRSVLFQMGLQIVMGQEPENGDAAGHAGVALGVSDILRHMAQHRVRSQVFVPVEIMNAVGLGTAQFLAIDDASKFDPVIAALTALGRDHMDKAREAVSSLEKPHRNAFLLLEIC
ncbi:MAG: phytoene/squalene synthase family protein, partial [Pseudomonadota bacterium]